MAERPFHPGFPHSDQAGHWPDQLDQMLIWQLAKGQALLTIKRLEKIHRQHQTFLQNGGAGGQWQILMIKGISMAHYTHESKLAGQAILERLNLAQFNFLPEMVFPFSSFCGCWAPGLVVNEAVLFHSIWTDAHLAEANFSNCSAYKSDFSRADLNRAKFSGADLRYCDFECANLTNADFRGANLSGAKFNGAILKNSMY